MAVTAGATFGVSPTWVIPEEPEFHLIETQAESMKKDFNLMSGSSSVDIYRLQFTGLSDTDYNGGSGVHDHFIGQNGGYSSFRWASVPSYINSGSDVTGRWVAGTFNPTPKASSWDVEVSFEHDKSLD